MQHRRQATAQERDTSDGGPGGPGDLDEDDLPFRVVGHKQPTGKMIQHWTSSPAPCLGCRRCAPEWLRLPSRCRTAALSSPRRSMLMPSAGRMFQSVMVRSASGLPVAPVTSCSMSGAKASKCLARGNRAPPPRSGKTSSADRMLTGPRQPRKWPRLAQARPGVSDCCCPFARPLTPCARPAASASGPPLRLLCGACHRQPRRRRVAWQGGDPREPARLCRQGLHRAS